MSCDSSFIKFKNIGNIYSFVLFFPIKGHIFNNEFANPDLTYVIGSFSNFFNCWRILSIISSFPIFSDISINFKQQIFRISDSESSKYFEYISIITNLKEFLIFGNDNNSWIFSAIEILILKFPSFDNLFKVREIKSYNLFKFGLDLRLIRASIIGILTISSLSFNNIFIKFWKNSSSIINDKSFKHIDNSFLIKGDSSFEIMFIILLKSYINYFIKLFLLLELTFFSIEGIIWIADIFWLIWSLFDILFIDSIISFSLSDILIWERIILYVDIASFLTDCSSTIRSCSIIFNILDAYVFPPIKSKNDDNAFDISIKISSSSSSIDSLYLLCLFTCYIW